VFNKEDMKIFNSIYWIHTETWS